MIGAMKALGMHYGTTRVGVPGQQGGTPFDPLVLVTHDEVAQMINAGLRMQLPSDFEQKLQKLKNGDLQQARIEQNCRIFFALLTAALAGDFSEATRQEIEQLARVLAYVRKEDDMIPDFRALGFTDDYQEVRMTAANYADLLQHFKQWRLRNQVPGLWLSTLKQPPASN